MMGFNIIPKFGHIIPKINATYTILNVNEMISQLIKIGFLKLSFIEVNEFVVKLQSGGTAEHTISVP
jgi:hypothetical protein